jgi:predicted O-methyltransferase YrrM
VYDDSNLKLAEMAFRKAVDMDPGNALGACFLGLILEQQCQHNEALPYLEKAMAQSAFCKCLVESFRYAMDNGPTARYFSNTTELLQYAVSESAASGLYMEFGVYHGESLRVIANSTDNTVHGFDSFDGLPEAWSVGTERRASGLEPGGAYTTYGQIPDAPANVMLHPGWFDDTLPLFAGQYVDKIAFMNIDCDIYSSTKSIFDCLGDRIKAGTVIVFDEYFCYPEWRDHEYKAFQEYILSSGLDYEYIAFSYFTSQAAVRILLGERQTHDPIH